jgi:hypothetical protein
MLLMSFLCIHANKILNSKSLISTKSKLKTQLWNEAATFEFMKPESSILLVTLISRWSLIAYTTDYKIVLYRFKPYLQFSHQHKTYYNIAIDGRTAMKPASTVYTFWKTQTYFHWQWVRTYNVKINERNSYVQNMDFTAFTMFKGRLAEEVTQSPIHISRDND